MAFPTTPTNGQKYIDSLGRLWVYTLASKKWNFSELSDTISNFTATIAPATTDDSSLGYGVGSEWFDTVADKSYICVDATAGAAIWVETDITHDAFPPLAADPATPTVAQSWFNTTSNQYKGYAGLPNGWTTIASPATPTNAPWQAAAGAVFDSMFSDTTSASFNGSIWTAESTIPTPRNLCGGAGTGRNSLLVFGGVIGMTTQVLTHLFNGTSWTAKGNLITARNAIGGCGTETAALAVCGLLGGSAYTNMVEKFNGTSWASSTGYPFVNHLNATVGTQTAALSTGGYNGAVLSSTYNFNGTTWTADASLLIARYAHGASGNASNAFVFGSSLTSSEVFNGTTWSASDVMNAAPGLYQGGTGGPVSALSISTTCEVHSSSQNAFELV